LRTPDTEDAALFAQLVPKLIIGVERIGCEHRRSHVGLRMGRI
jgi:hypothetical protein